jgi:amidohydrolase
MEISEIKKRIIEEINENSYKIIEIAEKIAEKPEMGYREFETARLVAEELSSLGIECREGLAVTGVKGNMKGRRSLARVAVIGELDAVTCTNHPKADRVTGAAHACGHNAQIASMLGAAMALSAVKDELDGDVCFFATPAEEFVEMGFREKLAERGDIRFFGGKQELIRLGEFDDIDMAMMIHAEATEKNALLLNGGSLGFVAKTVNFIGKAAHAGGAPHEGINALNAAMSAMMCIHAQRETFRDEDRIRVHPIITNGGELVNTVPAKVTMETYVRGASLEAIYGAAAKVDRAIEGGSYAIGATAEIKTYKGYLPLLQSESISALMEKNAEYLPEMPEIIQGVDMCGSSDVGDLSHLIPTIQPTMGGFYGKLHAEDFAVANERSAYLDTAKLMALTVVDLLYNGAEKALKIKADFKPKLTKEEYVNL